jgi:FKBP-type peptidyl-prolyl cis-trans isomerase 2
LNRPPWDVRHAAPSHAPGAAPRGGPDETLVADARAGLTPADMVERALQCRLRGGVVSASHVRMGPAHGRGRAAEAPPAASPAPPPPSLQEQIMQVVRPGDRALVHYSKCFQDGSVVSSRGRAPAEVTVGLAHPRLPGLGLALVGLAVGESRTLVVPARRAYGPYDPARVYRLARTRFPPDKALYAGAWVRAWGGRRLVRVVEVRGNMVLVDANRRWAGQSMELEVELVAIDGPEAPPRADQGAEGPTLALERDRNDDRWRDDGGQN